MISYTLFENLADIVHDLEKKRLADVFRFISFTPFEKYGPHQHARIEINYVKKGSCVLKVGDETVDFSENEMMIICSNVNHTFEAGNEGTTLMQLEFLPDIFTSFDTQKNHDTNKLTLINVFSESNRLIKIVNNVRIMRAVQRIINELNAKNKYFDYLIVMYYAELLILLYRHLDEAFMPIGTNDNLKNAILYLRMNYHLNISITDVAGYSGIGERYLHKLFVKHLDISPLDYLNQIRLNKATELLKNTELSIKEVCFKCGFKSPQYFSRVFKTQFGISPKDLLSK